MYIMITFVAALALLGQYAYATPTPSNTTRPCVEFMLPVSVTAKNAEYNLVQVHNNIDATAFAMDLDTWSSPAFKDRITRNFTVSKTYSISAQLCIPPKGAKKSRLHIASHGLAIDKHYWDVPINPSEYSYVQAALDAGYSILTYDRLGIGSSDKPDAYTVVQAPLELEILRRITEMARNGELLDHAMRAHQQTNLSKAMGTRFEKVIHVGHSYGSFLTSALLTTYGNLSDAAIITGFILNSKFTQLRYSYFALEDASKNNPQLFHDRGSGYLALGSKGSFQTLFFSAREDTATRKGGFESELLDYAYSIRQTITASEIASASQLNLGAAPNFTGPVQFILAEYDFPVCQGDCKTTYDPSSIKKTYPQAKDVDISLQKGTGHGLTLHRGANIRYKVTLDWLDKNGL